MSDEIIDINAEDLGVGGEVKTSEGMNIPDERVVEVVDSESHDKIIARRDEVNSMLPEYPKEWQTGEETKPDEESPDVNISLKEKEMKKIIKKYKRYMKNNLTEVKRLES